MRYTVLPILTTAVLLLTFIRGTQASSASEDWICGCGKHLLFPEAVGNVPGRKYARDRRVDIDHLRLDVTPDFAARSIAGTATLTFTPIARPLPQLDLDAVGLRIEKVEVTGAVLAEYQTTEEKLIVTFREPVPPETKVTVGVTYRAHPERGLYFRTPEMGYPATDTQVWSQGEPELHRFWYPGYDYPNERFTSEVICHAPEGLEVISNGRLVSREKEAKGLVATHWRQDLPHANYLVALACGKFHKLEDTLDGLPLAVFVPPSNTAEAPNTFLDTKKIIGFYQREIGVPFPWAKYYQVFCHDFVAGGMENTSCTFNAESLIFSTASEQLDTLHRLDAHETAHQWFGDLVTCRDWAHLWLNEGFATYYTVLYEQEKNGDDAMRHLLLREALEVFKASPDTKPIVYRDYADPMVQFDYRAYPKGAWVLHMLRSQLGPELFRKGIKTYLERHRGGIVTTDDLQQALEDVSGLSFDQFFDQWVYRGGFPELKVDYSWDAANKMAKLSVRQTQKVSEQVPLFQVPLPVRFVLAGGTVKTSTLAVSKESEDFYVLLTGAPEHVRIDPDYTLLAKVSFTPPGGMLTKQLTGGDMLGRFQAVQTLADKKDDESVHSLGKVLATDSFWAVRSEGIKALRKINTPLAQQELLAAPPQADARVRRDWVEALGASFSADSRARLVRLSQEEKNPEVLATIISSLATALEWKVVDLLGRDSYRQAVSAAVIRTLRTQDQQEAAPAVLARLRTAGNTFQTRDYAVALDALAFLSRKQSSPDEVLTFLGGHLTHPRERYRSAAAKALGTLGHPRGLALLEPLVGIRKPFKDPVRDAAEKSIQQIESRQSGAPELQSLVERIQSQQKKLEEMQQKLEALEKKTAPQK